MFAPNIIYNLIKNTKIKILYVHYINQIIVLGTLVRLKLFPQILKPPPLPLTPQTILPLSTIRYYSFLLWYNHSSFVVKSNEFNFGRMIGHTVVEEIDSTNMQCLEQVVSV